jgi:Zn-finger nucleic acid-binding protein
MLNCHDCGVAVNEKHLSGCDTEVCPECGHQWIGCGHDIDENDRIPWTGEMHAELKDYAIRRGLFCRSISLDGPYCRWEPCSKDHPDAMPDVNRAIVFATWNKKLKQFT